MVKKVIFIAGTKFGLRDYNRFGIKAIQRRGYKVEVWDFISWINPNYYEKLSLSDPLDSEIVKIFTSKNESNKSLKKLSSEDVVIDTFRIIERQRLSLNDNVMIGISNIGKIPQMYVSSISIRFFQIMKNPITSLNKILGYLSRKIGGNISYDFIIAAGKKSKLIKHEKLFNNSKLINTHSYDYDVYLAENKKTKESIFNHNYAVFLDEGVFHHPDIDYLGVSAVGKSEKVYYEELSAFFNKFEQLTNLEVVISLHPRIKKHKKFGQRKIFEGKTANLVRNANKVILHASTSISYAILYQKPVIFVDSTNFSKDYSNTIGIMANSINHKPINLSNNYELRENDFIYDKKFYDKYKNDYIKEMGTPDRPIWEIFCDYLDKVNA